MHPPRLLFIEVGIEAQDRMREYTHLYMEKRTEVWIFPCISGKMDKSVNFFMYRWMGTGSPRRGSGERVGCPNPYAALSLAQGFA